MEPINPQSSHIQESLQSEKTQANPDGWNGFFEKFSPDERKQFIRNMSHDISLMIQKQMRKMRESLKKLRSY